MKERPEPLFKVGDVVCFVGNEEHGEMVIHKEEFNKKRNRWLYWLRLRGTVSQIPYSEGALIPAGLCDEAKEPSRPTN